MRDKGNGNKMSVFVREKMHTYLYVGMEGVFLYVWSLRTYVGMKGYMGMYGSYFCMYVGMKGVYVFVWILRMYVGMEGVYGYVWILRMYVEMEGVCIDLM